MSTTRIMRRSVVVGVNRRTLASAFLLLPAILCPDIRSHAEEESTVPTARIAMDSATGGLQVELFRTGRQPTSASPAARAQSQPAIRPVLRPIIGAVPAQTHERLRAVHTLGRCLTREEITVLCDFVKSPPSPQETDLPGLQAVKNDILNVLRGQRAPLSGLTETLIALYRDPGQDAVIRDYAIQHLLAWHEQGAPDAANAWNTIRALLFEAAGESGAIAGTALLGLHLLSAQDPAIDQDAINRLALRLLCSADTEVASRITAIQVCAERGLKQATLAIQSVLEAQPCIPLRLSALAALARLGTGQQAAATEREEVEVNLPRPASLPTAFPNAGPRLTIF